MSSSLFVTEYLTISIRSLILISLRSIRSLISFMIYQKTQILKLIMKSKKQGIFIKSFLLFLLQTSNLFLFQAVLWRIWSWRTPSSNNLPPTVTLAEKSSPGNSPRPSSSKLTNQRPVPGSRDLVSTNHRPRQKIPNFFQT